MPMGKGMDLRMINSQLNAFGYKIARQGEDDKSADILPQENVKQLFPKQGERPEIKLKYAEKPLGTVGRKEYQLQRIIEISEEDIKFSKKVLKTFLYLDPDIDMDKAKGNNPPGPILRVIHKAAGVLSEFKIFEKDGYWPLDALVLTILKSTSQAAKGYAVRSRAKKREQEAAAQTEGITTGTSTKKSSAKTGRPRKTAKAPAIAQEAPSGDSNMEVNNAATRETVVVEEMLARENGEYGGKGESTDVGDEMDTSFKAPAPPGNPGATNEDEEEDLAQELSFMVLDSGRGNESDETPSPPVGPILPLDASVGPILPLDASVGPILPLDAPVGPIPPLATSAGPILHPDATNLTLSRSRSHPFNPSAPPRRQLLKTATGAGDRNSSGNPGHSTLPTPTVPATSSSHNRLPTTPLHSAPTSALPGKSLSVAATAGTPASATSSLQEPNSPSPSTPETIPGVTPELLAQLAVLPMSTLAAFSPALQAAVVALKSSTTTSVSNLTPTSTSASASSPALAGRPRIKVPARATPAEVTSKVAPVEASTTLAPFNTPFDDDEYLSDPPSASESNPPVNPELEPAPVPEPASKQCANATPAKSSKKKPGGKVAAVDPEGSAPKTQGKQGEVKEAAEATDLADAGGKGKKGGKGAGTGAKRGGGRKKGAGAVVDELVCQEPPNGAAAAGVDEGVSEEPPKRATRRKKAVAGK